MLKACRVGDAVKFGQYIPNELIEKGSAVQGNNLPRKNNNTFIQKNTDK